MTTGRPYFKILALNIIIVYYLKIIIFGWFFLNYLIKVDLFLCKICSIEYISL